MKVAELAVELKLRVFEPGDNMDRELTGGYASDLLSDVMGHAAADQIWITLQNHLNIVAIASLKDLAAIILVHGQLPAAEVLERAREEGVTLLGTESDTFNTAAQVFLAISHNEKSSC